MLTDRFANPLSTASPAARDAYVAGCDSLISASLGTEAHFRAALAADEHFALAHAGLARILQIHARIPEARAAMARAAELGHGTSAREQSHIAVFNELITGKPPAALAATRRHVAEWPRDAMIVTPACGVFGLIGFSGLAGREVDQLSFLDPLATHYGDDWWFRTVHGFAQVEVGDIAKATANLERALELFPRNANAAHIRAHVYYENGEPAAGLSFLEAWSPGYGKEGPMHCHISWHEAIWSLERGNGARAWAIYKDHLHPGGSWGPPINTLTDAASFLFRAELLGEPRRPELWRGVSEYAARLFGGSGVAFAAVHAALAHAMAGDGEALAKCIESARGPAGDVVKALAEGFGAFARQDWTGAVAAFRPIMREHEKIGGSRAQRDLVEHAMFAALLRSGQAVEARSLLLADRPGTTVADRLH